METPTPLHLVEAPSGGLRISDHGHTLMHISYDHDVDSFMDGTRGMLLERIMGESGLQWERRCFLFRHYTRAVAGSSLPVRTGADTGLRSDTPIPFKRRLHVL